MSNEVTVEIDPITTPQLEAEIIDHWVDVTNAGGAVGFVPPVEPKVIEPVAKMMLSKVADREAHLVVARLGHRLIGFSFLVYRPGPLFRHWATIKNLQVHPDMQREGIGTILIEAIHDAGRRAGLEQVHLTVRGGTGIEAFYEKLGYEVVSRVPDMIRVAEGDDREELYLRRYLSESGKQE